MKKVVSFFTTCRDFLYRIDAQILRIFRLSYGEPLMKLTISKYGLYMLVLGLGMMMATFQDMTSGHHYMMVIFSVNIVLMFLQNGIAELRFSEHFDELPDYTKSLTKDATDIRLFTGTIYLIWMTVFLLEGQIYGVLGFLSFILMQYTAACIPEKLKTT